MPFDNPYIPDINNLLSQHQRGLQVGGALRQQGALTQAGQAFSQGDQKGTVNALAQGGMLDQAVEMQTHFRQAARQADADKLAKVKRTNEVIGNLAMSADTPEKWAIAIDTAKRAGLDVAKWEDFGTRDYVLAQGDKTKEMIEVELKRRALEAKGATATSGMREYQFAMQQREAQGLPPISFEEYKKSSKGPLVEITGEKEYEKTRGKQLAEGFGTIQNDAQSAVGRIGQLRQVDSLLSDPNVYTGTGAASINALKRAGETLFGMDIKGVESADAARRISTEMALSLKQDLPGPMSNADRDFLQSIPPNIGDTAAGRKLLVELMIAKEERKVEIADLARQYAASHGGRLDDGWYNVLARYNAQKPVFTPEMMESARAVASRGQQPSPAAGVLPRVTDVKSYNAVPPGSRYIDPEGRIKTKGGR